MIPGFDQREKPLSANVGTVENTEPTFFYQRADGSVIMVKEAEAWTLHSNRNQMLGNRFRPPFVQVGVSDGIKYQQAVSESREIFRLEGLQAAQARIRKGFDEELEEAKKYRQIPRNFDYTDKDGLPMDLRTQEIILPNRRYENRTNQ